MSQDGIVSSGHTSRNTKFGWKPLLVTFPAISPSPSGPNPALLHAWHPGGAANHREFQILPRHLAQTPQPTSSCALSISQHPGSSFPRKRSLTTAHPAPFPMENIHGYRDRSSLSSGSRQDVVLLDLPAEVGEKGKISPKISAGAAVCHCRMIRGSQGGAGEQPGPEGSHTPKIPQIPTFRHLSHPTGKRFQEVWAKSGKLPKDGAQGTAPGPGSPLGAGGREGGRAQLAGSCWGWSCSRTPGQGTGQSQREHQVTELCPPTAPSSHGVGSDP